MKAESSSVISLLCSSDDDLSSSVRKFWEQKEAPRSAPLLSPLETKCLEHFTATHSRLPEGRYVVRLPLGSELPDLSETRGDAVRMLNITEQRYERDRLFRRLYTDFMREYEKLGHMILADPLEKSVKKRACYLPHHGVLREASASTKLRVVFNGSQKTSAGHSFNENLLVGPNLLPRLADVLLSWRRHRYVYATDVEKIYRQIAVHADDRDLQRIVWRVGEEMREFQLCTVTYGLACAPFLAIRTLHQPAEDEKNRFPLGAAVLQNDVYVDDIFLGASTMSAAMEARIQLEKVCEAGGFPLKKWVANADALLEGIPEENRSFNSVCTWQAGESHATLGLQWGPHNDSFSFII